MDYRRSGSATLLWILKLIIAAAVIAAAVFTFPSYEKSLNGYNSARREMHRISYRNTTTVVMTVINLAATEGLDQSWDDMALKVGASCRVYLSGDEMRAFLSAFYDSVEAGSGMIVPILLYIASALLLIELIGLTAARFGGVGTWLVKLPHVLCSIACFVPIVLSTMVTFFLALKRAAWHIPFAVLPVMAVVTVIVIALEIVQFCYHRDVCAAMTSLRNDRLHIPEYKVSALSGLSLFNAIRMLVFCALSAAAAVILNSYITELVARLVSSDSLSAVLKLGNIAQPPAGMITLIAFLPCVACAFSAVRYFLVRACSLRQQQAHMRGSWSGSVR